MHAIRAAPIRTVNTGLLGSPYGVFAGLRVSTSSPSRAKPLPTISAHTSLMRGALVERVQRAQLAPVAEVVHAAAEHVHVVDGDARKIHAWAAASVRYAFYDQRGGVLLRDTDALQLRRQRAQRVTAVQDVVDDQNRAASER